MLQHQGGLLSLCGTACWGEILTNENLQKRGIILVDWGCLCRKGAKTVDHLLLHCRFASKMGEAIWASMDNAKNFVGTPSWLAEAAELVW